MDSTEIIVNDCNIAHQWASSLTPAHSPLVAYAAFLFFIRLHQQRNANIIAMKILCCPLERPHAGIRIYICAGIFVYARLLVRFNIDGSLPCNGMCRTNEIVMNTLAAHSSFVFPLLSSRSIPSRSVCHPPMHSMPKRIVFFFYFSFSPCRANTKYSLLGHAVSLFAECICVLGSDQKWFASAHRHKLTSLFYLSAFPVHYYCLRERVLI